MDLKYITQKNIEDFIKSALQEDVGDGDHTSKAIIPEGVTRKVQILCKDYGVIAGVEMAGYILKYYNKEFVTRFNFKDGDSVKYDDVIGTIEGDAQTILMSERLILNCMQRMSGIATKTYRLSDFIKSTKAKLLDTRKTTPNFRMLEKWAVVIGGGVNHRFGLYDTIMLKDNHIDFVGGVGKAIKAVKDYLDKNNLDLPVIVETRNMNEVKAALKAGGVTRILLDNMLPSEMKQAVKLINGDCEIEASGGINENNILEVAGTGVDYISVGSLTHSYKSVDLSLKAV